ncbi:SpvB/TcaC N-terminal domain-containing protein [Photorhabdus australis]|uniref:SpvB/TcaC N-terminal domain-containing protein n=1 Tax=Photorhabdus australis TaxID=286156 RepID=UPI000564AA79|nr:SpvB/TcaC N-terminal domain-containing protein [Photorhabdus australis]
MQNSDELRLNPPALPAGGGAITGLKGEMAGAGPDGAAVLSLPLPVSAGRGYAPPLMLSYHSRAGNGPFGIGWNMNLPAVRRRTQKGVPAYDDTDEFTGPDGEVLVPVLTSDGPAVQRRADTLLGIQPGGHFTVGTYRARSESNFSRLEYWQPEENGTANDFWVLYSQDGQVHLLGRNAQARLHNPADPAQIAVWLLESSVSLTGEQIYYQYRAENDDDCDAAETHSHPSALAQRYLTAVHYGNLTAGRHLPGLGGDDPLAAGWLFILVLDYGERPASLSVVPDWPPERAWACRQDCFSGYEYGFDLRTRRLCRQVLMFHRLKTLAGTASGEDTPALVTCLRLEYHESPSISTLTAVHQQAYEPDGTVRALPPLTFSWQTFPPQEKVEWQPRNDLDKVNPRQPYQLIDLNGEGLAGVLYQDRGAWWYRAPERQDSEDINAVTWADATPLPVIPSLRQGATLTDLNGDGRLEWVVTAPGIAGHYDRTPERTWRHFTPLSALPVEYPHPQAQLADILGAGLSDMVLIGPRSVRLYAGDGDGWKTGQTVIQSAGVTLPVPGADDRTLVAFSDLPGSGQQHLVQVRADGVDYWPNLGHGKFGQPIKVPGFCQPAEAFTPDRLYLADIDGSGTMDLIYAQSDRLAIYLNQSGNRFADPFILPLPDGVRYDPTCSLQVADIQGLGVASLLLSIPHPVPRHWVCHLSADKPWLLNAMNNNMGARHTLHYRSSAQCWLDEKAAVRARGNDEPPCYLPFALHTLWRTESVDEITGNRLVSEMRYQHGVWDGQEREFRGFGYAELRDTVVTASQGSAPETAFPSLTRRWYATGLPAVDEQLPGEYWPGDKDAFTGFTPRFTFGSGEDEKAHVPNDATTFWMNRALKGILLRSELYGEDSSHQAGVPYTVTEARPQVRLIEAQGAYPVVWPAVVESRTYGYERVSSDPQCSQSVLLASDEYGQPLRQVSINYPRRAKPAVSPYPDTLPETLFASSYDEQQQALRLTLQQRCWHYLTDTQTGTWILGLPDGMRSDGFIYSSEVIPAGGLTLEVLQQSDRLLVDDQADTFVGQQQVWYLDAQNEASTGVPALPPRVAFTDTAVFDADIVQTLAGSITTEHLQAAGYRQTAYLFTRQDELPLWTARHGHTTYATAEHFWLPVSYRETELTGAGVVTRDLHDCVVTQYQDAAGLMTGAEYDYRFLTPVKVTDINNNVHTVTLDALGRVTSLRISGTENGVQAGYSDAALTLPGTADEMFSLLAPLPVAQCMLYITDSWQEGRGIPPHVVTLTTDRYDSEKEKAFQQVRQQVVFSDGFGRILQTAVRQAAGEAWQRADDGSLMVGTDGTPQTAATDFRWAVTGRTEYDNKGQPVRTYQPYFLNDWRYVSDDSARTDLYADTHYYDPVGREYQVLTAKGWLKRSLLTPWFAVSEDENDTASDNRMAG